MNQLTRSRTLVGNTRFKWNFSPVVEFFRIDKSERETIVNYQVLPVHIS